MCEYSIGELEEHCKRQIRRLSPLTRGHQEHLLTLKIIEDNRQLFSQINKKNEIIDLMAKEIKERNYNFTNKDIKEIKQYFEKRLE